MTFSSELIDEVVRLVIRELSLSTAAGNAALCPAGGVVELTNRVITEDVLAGLTASGDTVRIPAGAVITPSGKDHIRRHSLVVSSSASADSADSAGGVVVVVGDTNSISAPAASAGWTVAQAASDFEAASQVAQQCHNQPTVCCCAQPSIVSCLINRNSRRRAAVVTLQTCLADLLSAMNPDTVCLSAVGWSFVELRRLLHQLCRRDPVLPENWKELV